MGSENNPAFADENRRLTAVRESLATVVVGLDGLVERLLMALLCDGHVLIEGVPGLAKTLTVRALAQCFGVEFSRIQFTPDLLPGDLTGTLVYDRGTGDFSPHLGPIFANIVLADEINRAPAKVQSALLEAMQERQVTIGTETHRLDAPFLVLATQNPIEQDGTYPLPEAQLDRFMFKTVLSYPSMDEEHEIMRRMAVTTPVTQAPPVISGADLLAMRPAVDRVFASHAVERYILRLVNATRRPADLGLPGLASYIRHGASPRASIFLAKAARAQALLRGRDYIVPRDVTAVAPDVLRHRLSITYAAEANDVTPEGIIGSILDTVTVPGD